MQTLIIPDGVAIAVGENVRPRRKVISSRRGFVFVRQVTLNGHKMRRVNFSLRGRMASVKYPDSFDVYPVVGCGPVPDNILSLVAGAVKAEAVASPVGRRSRVQTLVVSLSETAFPLHFHVREHDVIG